MELGHLVAKLNPACRRALETGSELCAARSHFTVEVEHFVLRLLDLPGTDLLLLLRKYNVDVGAVRNELIRALDRLPRGSQRTPTLSPHVLLLLQEGWLVSSLQLGSSSTRSAGILKALLDHETLRGVVVDSSPTLLRLHREPLDDEIADSIRGSAEERAVASPAESSRQPGICVTPGNAMPEDRSALDQYTVDLTAQARAGLIDPVHGRDFEVRQIIDILTRRRQNNPILTGDAGVGKTAIVEGFAMQIASGAVPGSLRNVTLRSLDIGLLQAGAGVRGEFENRLKSVVAEIKASVDPIILFIDEAHTLIGPGAHQGQLDAASLLKPALARGDLRTIAATTWSEYKKYFEKDAALTRRFQVVPVEEPEEHRAVSMMRTVASRLEEHHGVRILDAAIRSAVHLSKRYISGRKLPDKAVSVLDTACARVALGQTGTPPEVDRAEQRMAELDEELRLLRREQLAGYDHAGTIRERTSELESWARRRDDMHVRWQQELQVFGEIRNLERQVENATAADRTALALDLDDRKALLAGLQGHEAMVPLQVDEDVVAGVISGWTGIPVGKMLRDEIRDVLRLQERLEARVIGQSEALRVIAERIQTSRADLTDPRKPAGVFLLAGPSGVGKTETAIALADLLYGGEDRMVVVNMSEYQESHTVSALKGAPPGYVGYGSGGILTEAVRRNPYSVVLLDEAEKAHPDVMELFYQVFDKGILEDGEGVPVDFKNTVILLTCNLGSERILDLCAQGDARPSPRALVDAIRASLVDRFKPALLGRLTVVPYYPLGEDVLKGIVRLKLGRIRDRFREAHRAELTFDEGLIDWIASQCTRTDTGARNVDHILLDRVLPGLSGEVLQHRSDGTAFERAHVTVRPDGRCGYVFEHGQIPALEAES